MAEKTSEPIEKGLERDSKIDEIIKIIEIQERIKKDGIIFKIKKALRMPGTSLSRMSPKKRKASIKKMVAGKTGGELDEEISNQREKLQKLVSSLKKSKIKSDEFENKMKETREMMEEPEKETGEGKDKGKAQAEVMKKKQAQIEKKISMEEKKTGSEISEKITPVLKKRKAKEEKPVVSEKISLDEKKKTAKIKIREKSKFEQMLKKKTPPRKKRKTRKKAKKVKKGRVETKKKPKTRKVKKKERGKSKFEQMLKKKGPGWFGDKLRHSRAALKAWQTRRKKELENLKIKEQRSGLNKKEKLEKKKIVSEMQRLANVVSQIETHLEKINQQEKKEKSRVVSRSALPKEVREETKEENEAKEEKMTEEMQRLANVVSQIETHLEKINQQEKKEKTVEINVKAMEQVRIAAEKATEAADKMPTLKGVTKEHFQTLVDEIKQRERKLSIPEQIGHLKGIAKRLEADYYKRKISEEEFRERISEIRQKIAELESRQNILENQQYRMQNQSPPQYVPPPQYTPAQPQAVQANEEKKTKKKRGRKKKMEKVKEPVQAPQPQTITITGRTSDAPSTQPAAKTETMPAVRAVSKVSAEINRQKIDEIESHMSDLLKKYKISDKGVEREVGNLDKNKIIQDFDKLINLIELEKETKELNEMESMPREKIPLPITSQKKEKIKAIAKEIKKHKIVTDYDLILAMVMEKGKAGGEEIRKILKMDKKHFKECCDILENDKLVKITYPTIGRMKIMDINYKEPEKEKKKKKKKKMM